MGKRSLPALLCLCLLAGCAAPAPMETPAPTPTVEITPTPEPPPTPEPTKNPAFAWRGDYFESERYATIEGFGHMPVEELPQELRDSLTWDGEIRTEQGYSFWLRTYTAPGIEIVTTEAPPEVLEQYREDTLESWRESGESWENWAWMDEWTSQEAFEAEIEGEMGREWLYSVTVTDDTYATIPGLRVGMTIEEAEAVGYPLREQTDYTIGFGPHLRITLEDGVVTQMYNGWGIGRHVGRYWDI